MDKTDVLEVYLKHPDSDIYINHAVEIDKQIAWTMAVVLRQALADVLGIASDDTVLQLSQQHCQIVLMQWQPSLFMSVQWRWWFFIFISTLFSANIY